MSKFFKTAVSFALLIALLLGITGCKSENGEIKSLTSKFEKACNVLDFNEILDCIDPRAASGVRLATGVVGVFMDKESDELLDGLAKVILGKSSNEAKELFSSIDINIENIEINGDTATADAMIKYTVAGEKIEDNVVLEYLKDEGKWYIGNFNIG